MKPCCIGSFLQVGGSLIGKIPRSVWVVLDEDLVETCKAGDDVVVIGHVVCRWSALGRLFPNVTLYNINSPPPPQSKLFKNFLLLIELSDATSQCWANLKVINVKFDRSSLLLIRWPYSFPYGVVGSNPCTPTFLLAISEIQNCGEVVLAYFRSNNL